MSQKPTVAQTSKRAFFARSDLLILIALLVIAAVAWGIGAFVSSRRQANQAIIAEITWRGQLVRTVQLTDIQNETFVLSEEPKVSFEVKENAIRFIQTECPDHLCEKNGWLSKTGQSAVCLPNRVAVKIIGEDHTENDFDIMVN